MGISDILEKIFLMAGGLAVFMYGIKIMGEFLENLAGSKTRKLLGRITSNPFKGIGVGAVVTGMIHSSSAVTVMIIGFVNVGLMNLSQATAIIMGANIGTTLTAQMMAISGVEGSFNINSLISLFAAVGLVMHFVGKKDKTKLIGGFFFGVGLIFIGLTIMSDAMASFKNFEPFMKLLQYNNPLVLLIAGVVVTAVIQSSGAVTGIVLALAGSGLGLSNAFFIILGSNIGTCITAVMSSVGASANAKRAAMIHLLFNVTGAIIFFIPLVLFTQQIADLFVKISGNNAQWQIANFHMAFNVLSTLLLLPFIKQIVSISQFLVKDKPQKETFAKLNYLDERMLETPSIAVANVKKEIVFMANTAFTNLKIAMNALISENIDEADNIRKTEEYVNFLNKEITAYLVKISSKEITATDEKLIGSYYHVVSDIERIGDYAENMLNYTEKILREQIGFSEEAKNEITAVFDMITDLYKNTITAFEKRDTALLKQVITREDEIDESKRNMSKAHVERLHKGMCSPESGAVYLLVANNLERVADHMTNIAYSTKMYNAGGTR